jgi:hypothetical protein
MEHKTHVQEPKHKQQQKVGLFWFEKLSREKKKQTLGATPEEVKPLESYLLEKLGKREKNNLLSHKHKKVAKQRTEKQFSLNWPGATLLLLSRVCFFWQKHNTNEFQHRFPLHALLPFTSGIS